MSDLHRALAVLGFGLTVGLLLGMVLRRRVTACITFSLLVLASAGFTGFFLVFPDRNTLPLYLLRQGLYDSLLFGLAIELAFRTFAAFRGAASRVRLLLASAVVTSTAGIFLLTPNSAHEQFWKYQPSVTTAAVWCLTAVALLIVWYQIPVSAFIKSIILGYVPYLVVFVICVDLIGRLGFGVIPKLNLINAAAFDLMAASWAYTAWQKD